MPPMCRFYGIAPEQWRRIALPDLIDMLDHMNVVTERERQQYGG